MSTTTAALAASPAAPRTFGLSGCSSAKMHGKKLNPFYLLKSESSCKGRRRKHIEHRDITCPTKRHTRNRSALKLRIVRTTAGYKAFPVAESLPSSETAPIQPSQHNINASTHTGGTSQGHEVARDLDRGPYFEAYSNKIRIVRGRDGEYKAYSSSSAPPTPTESRRSMEES